MGLAGTIVSSPAAFSWTAEFSGSTQQLNCVKFINNKWTVGGNNGTMLSSSNGSDWTVSNLPTSSSIIEVGFTRNLWFAVASSGDILISSNAVNWTTYSFGLPSGLAGALFETNRILAIGGLATIVSIPVENRPALLATLVPASNSLMLALVGGDLGKVYQLQFNPDLGNGNWTTLGPITNNGSIFSTNVQAGLNNFFRLAEP